MALDPESSGGDSDRFDEGQLIKAECHYFESVQADLKTIKPESITLGVGEP